MTLVGTVESIAIYPLTGARGIDCEQAELGRGGFAGDHNYLLYEVDPKTGQNMRVSQKQCRMLAQLTAELDDDGSLLVERDPNLLGPSVEPWRLHVPNIARASLAEVIEFGDPTPCHDMGDEASLAFSALLERDGVRLGRKTDEWLAGGRIPPVLRANATVHAGLAETVEHLVDHLPNERRGATVGAERLRAQLIIRGFPAFADAGWVGGNLLIGERAVLRVDRHTKRCPVPGTDQRTGQNRKDLPAVYPLTVKAPDDGKPTIGVYGHSKSDDAVVVRRGDSVRWVRA